MKIRTDFVTNSSSSSFVCEICGRVESGWDVGVLDAEMLACVNGHTFCNDEAIRELTREEMVRLILENEYNSITEQDLTDKTEWSLFVEATDSGYAVPECMCPICQFIEYSEYDLSAYLLKEYGVPRDEVFAEVKKFNKRRKKLYDNEYITYVCKKFDLNPVEIVASWKNKFTTYCAFKDWLRCK